MGWASRAYGTSLVVVGLALAAPPAAAAPTAAEKETARKLVKSGRAKQKAGDFAAAIEDLKAAHAIMGVPTTGLALGKAQIAAGRWVEARDTLLAVTRIPKSGREPYQFVKARKVAKSTASDLEPRIPQLELELKGAPDDKPVSVRVDDVEIKSAALSLPLSLNPGRHVVVAVIEGREKSTDVELVEGQKSSLVLDVSGIAEGQAAQATPSAKPPVAKGTSLLVPIGFGVAGAGVLVGGVTGFMALSKKSTVDEQCVDGRCPPSTHDDIDSGRTLGDVSTIAFIVAGVGAGIGVYGLMNPPSEPSEDAPPSSAASLWIGPGSAGLRGRF